MILPAEPNDAATRRRHSCYRQLLAVCLLLLGCLAIPAQGNRLAGLIYNLMLLPLITGLGHPFAEHRGARLLARLYRWLGLSVLAADLLWSFGPEMLRGRAISLLLLWGVFALWSTLRLVHSLAQERRVNGQVLMGALAGYLMMGLTTGLVFAALESLAPGSFHFNGQPISTALPAEHGLLGALAMGRLDFQRLNSFAFVSLTTTGYGDVLPVSAPAQMASVTIAVAGNFYLAVVMGLLISRFMAQEQNGPATSPPMLQGSSRALRSSTSGPTQ